MQVSEVVDGAILSGPPVTGEYTLETAQGPITARRYSAHAPRGTLVLAHGAGAGQQHPFMRAAAATFATAGFETITFDFPYMENGRRVPDPAPVLEASFAEVAAECCARWINGRGYFVGGKSMGGRIASQAAARGLFDRAPAGLVFLGYPLHPPGKPEKRRDAHLPSIAAPMLFVHGTRDPFGTSDEMRQLAGRLPRATLTLIEGGGHSFEAPKRDGGDKRDAAFAAAISWMTDRVHAPATGRRTS